VNEQYKIKNLTKCHTRWQIYNNCIVYTPNVIKMLNLGR
jgi:hypothetical protein